VSWIARVVRTWLAPVAAIASAAGIALFVETGRQQSAWLAIGGLLALTVSLVWRLWAAERFLESTASRRAVIVHLGLLARVGNARLRIARIAGADAATLSEHYAAWEREVCKTIEEEFGHGELALFEAPVSAQMPRDLAGVTATWRERLERLADLILRRGEG
jgi:hypothetical protein